MKSFLQILSVGCMLLLVQTGVYAQQASKFDPHQAFDQTFMDNPGTAYRSGNGSPGPEYWQNEADYKLDVSLDPENNRIEGTDVITYTNNSPDELNTLWIQLDQNLFGDHSRGALMNRPKSNAEKDEPYGYDLSNIRLERNGRTIDADYSVIDTRLQIRLQQPLKPKGGKVKISMHYGYTISPRFIRSGRMDTDNGPIFDIAQWYPRMCVYDDVRGWNTLPYLGAGEFYLDYGNYDVSITTPWDMVVLGSGELQNPGDVLTKEQRSRLDKARNSDETVHIIKPGEVGDSDTRPVQKGNLTWHYKIKNARDVAWSASNAFVWDAVGINLPNQKKALAMAAYPKEVGGDDAWGNAAQFVKGTIEINSKNWFEYPWPVATVVADPGGGMEYPGIVFVGRNYKTNLLWRVINHEFGHNWFPMIVGSQERRYAWMDEGLNTFIDAVATNQYKDGAYLPYGKWQAQPRYLDSKFQDPDIGPLETRPDLSNDVGFIGYRKPGLGLYLLRNYVLGKDRFDYAFRIYTHRWAYKHPTPRDFFRTMNNETGEDLDWFWNGWFYKTWTIDQAVTDVHYIHADPKDGSYISLENLDKMPMPVKLKVVESNGKTHRLDYPVEIWQQGANWTVRVNTTSRVDSVIVDPDHRLPDVNPRNNTWVRSDIHSN